MEHPMEKAALLTKRLPLIARILSILVIGFTLIMAVGHLVGGPDPYAVDYPPIENLLPALMVLSVLGLGIAWRWEGAGGAINLVFFLATIILDWVIRGEFIPLGGFFPLLGAIIPGILFLIVWWRTRDLDSKTLSG